MIIIGIDPHKSTHTATSLEPATNTDLGSLRIEATLAEYTRLLTWSKTWPQRTWAIENAEGLGHHLAQWLLAAGESVLDIPTTATARVRQLSKGSRRKNDRIDAAAAASVAAMQGDARAVHPESITDMLALLDERRNNLTAARTRTANQLHALLRQLFAGGVPTQLTASRAATAIRRMKPRTTIDSMRMRLCRDLIADLKRYDTQLADNHRELASLLDQLGTSLRDVPGVGTILAGRLIGRTGIAHRFPTTAAFATYNGTAPVQIASAQSNRHRLSRYGDRQLNSAIHTVAMVQIRMPDSAGRAYYDKKRAAGMAPKSAMRCLKRHLSNHLWRIMIADGQRQHTHRTSPVTMAA
ncbi:IS110 family transposase [Rhodococcus sp. OK302]|uniref:IS110 family transposase n=1 Tax=Rhodococcus sp. OK302 TaxID=1882769 RepID=UPI000B9413E5|nr:IS110 family transposase [Rhodococcus sp. OK302]OYD61287.1 transposase [Rhodococcus sp. OK302]